MIRFTEHLRRRLLGLLPRFSALAAACCALALALCAMTWSLGVVIVSDSNGSREVLITREQDPQRLMAEAGIEARESDAFYYTAYNGSLASLSIQRAFPVRVMADGQEHVASLVSGTVERALELCGVSLGEHDYTEPSLHEPVTEDTVITVHRVEYRDTLTYESIPFETEYVYTSLFYRNRNRTVTLQEGHEGTNEITNRERVVDGRVESSQIVSIVETVSPQNTIIKAYAAGAPVSPLDGPAVVDGVPSSYTAVYTGRATGYSASRGRGASGLGLHYGTVAVNPALIPYGTKLYITSTDGRFIYGYAIATDTGGALLDGSALVDLFYESYSEALMNGVQQVNVYVIG